MGKSRYEIRIAGTVPLDLLENFRQIQTVEPAGTILRAEQLDDAALWGLIDALRNAGVDLIEIRRDVDRLDLTTPEDRPFVREQRANGPDDERGAVRGESSQHGRGRIL